MSMEKFFGLYAPKEVQAVYGLWTKGKASSAEVVTAIRKASNDQINAAAMAAGLGVEKGKLDVPQLVGDFFTNPRRFKAAKAAENVDDAMLRLYTVMKRADTNRRRW